LLPYILAFLALGLNRLLLTRRFAPRVIGVAAIIILAGSALEIRFAPRHQRDDYRTATAEAREAIAQGKKLWWFADPDTAAYYKLPLNSPKLTLVNNQSPDTLPSPDIIVISKPDIYDPRGEIERYLRQHNFELKQILPAFQIFHKHDES
jgi:hypothetical protein